MNQRRAFAAAGGAALVTAATLVAAAMRRRPAGGLEPATPVALSSQRAPLHRTQRPILSAAARSVLGRDPTLAELQYLQAVAWLESSYARGWKGPMVASNNYGAVQCSRAQAGVGGVPLDLPAAVIAELLDLRAPRTLSVGAAGVECVAYEDSYADGTKYHVSFRKYATAQEGANDLARHVLRQRPAVLHALQSAAPSASRASLAMRREKYFEGFCPGAAKTYGAAAVRPSLRDPDRDAATLACEEEAVRAHARRIYGIASEVATATGDPQRLPLGTYADALAWWKAGAK